MGSCPAWGRAVGVPSLAGSAFTSVCAGGLGAESAAKGLCADPGVSWGFLRGLLPLTSWPGLLLLQALGHRACNPTTATSILEVLISLCSGQIRRQGHSETAET